MIDTNMHAWFRMLLTVLRYHTSPSLNLKFLVSIRWVVYTSGPSDRGSDAVVSTRLTAVPAPASVVVVSFPALLVGRMGFVGITGFAGFRSTVSEME